MLLFFVIGCDKKSATGPSGIPPKTSGLISPARNELCTTGTILSDTESNITFVWGDAENANLYELIYKNLETGKVINVSTSATSITVKLTRNTPYSWMIISKSLTTMQTATSEVWKFYNAGIGGTTYAPYPAELNYPSIGASIRPVSGKISLAWNGADVDGDITNYAVYFGTTEDPPLYKEGITTTNLADISVNNNTTYYWMVVTRDSKGNTSNSGINQFKTI